MLDADSGVNLGFAYETGCVTEWSARGHKLFYFDSKKLGKVDFLINGYERLNVFSDRKKSGKDQNNFRAIPKLVSGDGAYILPCGYVFGNKNIVEVKIILHC